MNISHSLLYLGQAVAGQEASAMPALLGAACPSDYRGKADQAEPQTRSDQEGACLCFLYFMAESVGRVIKHW